MVVPPSPCPPSLLQWSYGGKSDGGVLLTRWLAAGEAYTFSLAGRSPLAAVDAFVFFACDPAGGSCQDDSAAYATAVAAATATNPDCTPVAAGGGGDGGGGDQHGGGAVDTGRCALTGGDAAGGVVPAEAGVPPADGWADAAIPGGAGLVWRPDDAAGPASVAGTGRRDYVWTPPAGGGTFRLVLRAAGVRPWANHECVCFCLLLLGSAGLGVGGGMGEVESGGLPGGGAVLERQCLDGNGGRGSCGLVASVPCELCGF